DVFRFCQIPRNFGRVYFQTIETGSHEPNRWRRKMINLSNITAGLVLGLVVTSAVPALAGSRHVVPGHNARAQAIEQSIGEAGVSPSRAQALRECNDIASQVKGYNLITSQFALYRSCMVQHGQQE